MAQNFSDQKYLVAKPFLMEYIFSLRRFLGCSFSDHVVMEFFVTNMTKKNIILVTTIESYFVVVIIKICN